MRRLIAPALLAALLTLAPAACKRRNPPAAVSDEPPKPAAANMVSALGMGDPHTAIQLTQGFYNLEANTWRWTMKNFTVQLRTPPGAAESGAALSFKFNIPETVSKRLGSLTLSATVNGIALAPETYAKAGNYTYARPVAANALSADVSTIAFALDKALPPGDKDARELGVISISVGLATQK